MDSINAKPKTKKLLKNLSILSFAVLLCCIVLTIIFHSHKLLWLFIILDLILLLLFFIPFSMYSQIIYFQRINAYLLKQSSFSIVDEFLKMLVDKSLNAFMKGHGFSCGGNVHKNEPEFGFTKIFGNKQLWIELNKNSFRYFIGNKRTEEQDMSDDEFIVMNYDDVKLNCTIQDFLKYIDEIDMNIVTEK